MGNPLDPSRDHRISLADAAAQTKAHRDGRPPRLGDSGAFNAKAVLELLQQPGCVGLRYYKGRNKAGESSLILVGVDAEGNDLNTGALLDFAFPCPPFCPDGSPLNG